MDLPIYCVIDTRPVKVVEAEDGAVEVWAWDGGQRDFVRRLDLLERVLMQDEWVVELTEGEFLDQVARLEGPRTHQRTA